MVDVQNLPSFCDSCSLASDPHTTRLGRGATLAYLGDDYSDYSFIAVLGLAQRLKIDLLPITWQSPLGLLGRSRAEISQALINLQTSFAFKRFDHAGQSDPLREAVQEMVILRHPLVRDHPYIVKLLGICWDIPQDNQVWPVLVFEKTHLGDLYHFARSNKWKQMSLEDRLNICTDVGIAIRDMHLNNIIHGDIKPQNVLIFEDRAGTYIAKVADFGFSTHFHKEEGLIQMPKSVPWNAPEHHSRYFNLLAAKRMDIYSFGLVCLWLIFGATLSTVIPLPRQTTKNKGQFISFEGPLLESNPLECWKHDSTNKLLEWAAWLVMEGNDFKNGMDEKLARFFDLTLVYKPEDRCTDFKVLLSLLAPDRALPQQPKVSIIEFPQPQEHFQIEHSLYEFYSADFRLRSHIAKSLNSIASELTTQPFRHISPQEAAFQLAFCYRIGFGVARNKGETKKFIDLSSRSDEDLEHKVELIRVSRPSWSLQDGIFKTLLGQGHIRKIDFPQHYREKDLLLKAEDNYKREITDVKEMFGETHWLITLLQSGLALIFYDIGRWKEAEELEVQVMETSSRVLGEEHPDTLTSIANLASTFWNQGRWKEAEELEVQVMETRKRVLGEEHPSTQSSMANLASTFWN